ncbi:MAG: hypothetical protein M3094_07300, partial [Actinomycetia bacterium]|nr:hypothetical protein [Actinomycetes bacterium]
YTERMMPDRSDKPEMPSSDELIRRAKRDFAPTVYSRTYQVVSRAEDIEKMVEETMNTDAIGEAMAEAMATDSVMDPADGSDWMMSGSRPQAPTPQRSRPVLSTQSSSAPMAPYPASSSETSRRGGGNTVLLAVGWFLLIAMAGVWVLLLIGAAQDPDNAGSVIGGGVVLTAIPLILAFLIFRAARRSKPSQGIIS